MVHVLQAAQHLEGAAEQETVSTPAAFPSASEHFAPTKIKSRAYFFSWKLTAAAQMEQCHQKKSKEEFCTCSCGKSWGTDACDRREEWQSSSL